ncbi:MAG: hypothetical protein ACD_75C00221G0003 [uncultured bacterium]|nr:MAG: hypothetical protein ACD_75C00221G0003 [uncultured bacterium]
MQYPRLLQPLQLAEIAHHDAAQEDSGMDTHSLAESEDLVRRQHIMVETIAEHEEEADDKSPVIAQDKMIDQQHHRQKNIKMDLLQHGP